MLRLTGKNILVTGGSKGIGKAIAEEFASRHASLFLVARNLQDLQGVQREILARYPYISCQIFSADVSDPSQIKAAIDTMIETMGSVDGLVNNAGINYAGYFEKISTAKLQELTAVNFLGAVYSTQFALPYMKEGSFIAFTSSVAGYLGVFGYSIYSATKFALIGFAESLEQELISRKIRVAVLCPPDTDTPGLIEERKSSPYETRYLSGQIKPMPAQVVARRFLEGLASGTFLINVNFESKLYYFLRRLMPRTMRMYMHLLLNRAVKRNSLIMGEKVPPKAIEVEGK